MVKSAAEDVLDVVLRTCEEAASTSSNVVIDDADLRSFAKSLDAETVRAAFRPLVFPIKYDSIESEVNFLTLYHLLDFGSGYNNLLLDKNQRDAHETIQFGVLGALLSGKAIDRHFMASFTLFHVSNYFGIEHMEEQEVSPGIMMSKPGPLTPLARLIQATLASTGQVLGELGHSSLGALVMSILEEQRASGAPSAAALVQKLAALVPAFEDSAQPAHTSTPPLPQQQQTAEASGAADVRQDAAGPSAQQEREEGAAAGEVVLLRKAQALAGALYLRFHAEDPRFDFQDVHRLSADSGPVLPAVLRKKGVLRYSQQLEQIVDEQQPLVAGSQDEVAIRAAAVVAADRIARAVGSAFTPGHLSAYLCLLADPGQQLDKAITCHLTRSTVAY